jgi:hypothetical protein
MNLKTSEHSLQVDAGSQGLTLAEVSKADHPAIARAVEEILRDRDSPSMFSNFVSHSSAAE